MALPQQVIDRLSKEPPKTPGWSFGVLSFSGSLFFIVLIIYLGLLLGYEPFLSSQTDQLNTQVNQLANSISPSDQAQLLTFYSEIANIKSSLMTHVTFSQFFTWLEQNTEANVYFSLLTYGSKNQVTLTGIAKSEADVNQQMAIFEAAPKVKSATISSVALSPTTGLWQFSVGLTMDPSVFEPALVVQATSSSQ